MHEGVGKVYEVNRASTFRRARRVSRVSSIVMDKSQPKIRTDSSNWESNFKGSRVTKSTDSENRLMDLRVTLHLLNIEFNECSSELSYILKKRNIVANQTLASLETLRYVLDCYKHAMNVCKKVDEKIDAATLELRDESLNVEREQFLQETIETFTEIREELNNTKRDVELCLFKCRLHERELNRLKASDRHVMLSENLAQIIKNRKKIVNEMRVLTITENIEEDELEDLILN